MKKPMKDAGQDERCPQCGSVMVREGSYHHNLIKDRKKGGE